MLNFFSWFLVPFLTVCIAGTGDWTKTNFSVEGSRPPGQLFLILWGLTAGGHFYLLLRRTMEVMPESFSGKKPVRTARICGLLLAVSVLLPYLPEQAPFAAAVHVACAFLASAVLYLLLVFLAFRMYFTDPDRWRLRTAVLLSALPVCLALFLQAQGIISSSLEVFFTIFCCIWLNRFYHALRRSGLFPFPQP